MWKFLVVWRKACGVDKAPSLYEFIGEDAARRCFADHVAQTSWDVVAEAVLYSPNCEMVQHHKFVKRRKAAVANG